MKNKGFTLVELLVVMVILGILASLIGPSFLNLRRKSSLNNSIQNFKTALEEAFSSSRSKSRIYGIGIGGREDDPDKPYTNKKIHKFSYDYKSCYKDNLFDFSSEECQKSKIFTDEPFEGSVHLTQEADNSIIGGFFIYFIPPYGNISAGNGNFLSNVKGEDDVLEITLVDDYDNKKSFKIYERSGLISK
jgi:prepilin-type N-terminal cleavage/methylation domain-containing protein